MKVSIDTLNDFCTSFNIAGRFTLELDSHECAELFLSYAGQLGTDTLSAPWCVCTNSGKCQVVITRRPSLEERVIVLEKALLK